MTTDYINIQKTQIANPYLGHNARCKEKGSPLCHELLFSGFCQDAGQSKTQQTREGQHPAAIINELRKL